MQTSWSQRLIGSTCGGLKDTNLANPTLNFKPSLNKACASRRFTSSNRFCPASLLLSTFTDTLSFLPGRILLMSSQIELLNLPYFLLWNRIWVLNSFSFDLASLCIDVTSWNYCFVFLRWQLMYQFPSTSGTFLGFLGRLLCTFLSAVSRLWDVRNWIFTVSGSCCSSLICTFCLALYDIFQFLCFALCLAFFATDKISLFLLSSLAFLFLFLSVLC